MSYFLDFWTKDWDIGISSYSMIIIDYKLLRNTVMFKERDNHKKAYYVRSFFCSKTICIFNFPMNFSKSLVSYVEKRCWKNVYVIMCLNFQPDQSPHTPKSKGGIFAPPRAQDWFSDPGPDRVKVQALNRHQISIW